MFYYYELIFPYFKFELIKYEKVFSINVYEKLLKTEHKI